MKASIQIVLEGTPPGHETPITLELPAWSYERQVGDFNAYRDRLAQMVATDIPSLVRDAVDTFVTVPPKKTTKRASKAKSSSPAQPAQDE